MILYTIIIPHYNTPELLYRCINSIPQRDDLEVIVVDDNSSQDKTPLIERADVTLIRLDASQSKGAGHARNVALEKARGRWLLFADSDDYFIDGFLSTIDRYANDDIDVLYYGYNFVDKSNLILNDTIETCRVLSRFEDTKYNVDLIRFNNYVPWSKMVRRTYVEKCAIKFEEVKNGNDILFSLLVASYSTRFKVDGTPVYIYVRNENSLTTQKLSTAAHLCRIEHFVKLSQFYNKIDHSEWNVSCFRYVLYVFKKDGIKSFLSLILAVVKELPKLINKRNEFVKLTNLKKC